MVAQGYTGNTSGGGGPGAVASVNGKTGTVVLNADDLADGTTQKMLTATERTKLAGVVSGATANATDAQLRDRATHTGTQSADTLTDGTTVKAYTATERTKLAGVATGATANATDAQLRDRATHTGTQSADTLTDGATNKVLTGAAQTFTGAKTFDSSPLVPSPTVDAGAASKAYADTRAGSRILAYQYAPFASVANTTAESTVCALNVPDSSVTAGRQLIFEAAGVFQNNSGSSSTFRVQLRLPGGVVLTSGFFSLGTATTQRKWTLRWVVNIINATSQVSSAAFSYSLSGAETWSNFSAGSVGGGFGQTSIDFTGGGALSMTLAMQLASPDYFFRADWASLTETAPISAANTGPASAALEKGQNLADLPSAVAARGNMGLGDSATRNVGSAAGTVAAGDDPRLLAAGSHLLVVGDESLSRELVTANGAGPVSGQLRLTYFTARKSETSTQVRMYTGGTAAGATPTLCRIGIWSIAANGDGTLVAATANDTALFTVASIAYTRSWQTPFTKVAGQRYAIGPLIVSAATMQTFMSSVLAFGAEAAVAPQMTGVISSLSDLPSTFTAGQSGGNGHRYYAVCL